MFRTTLKGILAHKLRLVLTAMSIVLGVAFVAGTFVLTDSLRHTINGTAAEALEGVDAGVRSESSFGNRANDLNLVRNPMPDTVLATVESVPGVGDAVGGVGGEAIIIATDGDAIMAAGTSWTTNEELIPVSYTHLTLPTILRV